MRRQTAKCLYRVITRDFDDQSATRGPQILRRNTGSSHRFHAVVGGTQIESALPLELGTQRIVSQKENKSAAGGRDTDP